MTSDIDLSGKTAPLFELTADDQRVISLGDLTTERPTLLAFVYGTYCPTCVHTYNQLALNYDQIVEAGVGLCVVSLDDWNVSQTFKMAMRQPMPFPVLADVEGKVHQSYGVYRKSSAFFLVDCDGTVRGSLIGNEYPGTNIILSMIEDATQAA